MFQTSIQSYILVKKKHTTKLYSKNNIKKVNAIKVRFYDNDAALTCL